MTTDTTTNATIRVKPRAWNDFAHRDRFIHIINDDEHAANLLCEVFPDMDQRHPYALCGVTLTVFPNDPPSGYVTDDFADMCPECTEIEQHNKANT